MKMFLYNFIFYITKCWNENIKKMIVKVLFYFDIKKSNINNKMSIKVFVSKIDYKPILEYYNQHKKIDDVDLEYLDRCEGGFQIKIIEKQKEDIDENKKIRQLRWNSGYLISHRGYTSFTTDEKMLLFESLQNVLGEDNVVMEEC